MVIDKELNGTIEHIKVAGDIGLSSFRGSTELLDLYYKEDTPEDLEYLFGPDYKQGGSSL